MLGKYKGDKAELFINGYKDMQVGEIMLNGKKTTVFQARFKNPIVCKNREEVRVLGQHNTISMCRKFRVVCDCHKLHFIFENTVGCWRKVIEEYPESRLFIEMYGLI